MGLFDFFDNLIKDNDNELKDAAYYKKERLDNKCNKMIRFLDKKKSKVESTIKKATKEGESFVIFQFENQEYDKEKEDVTDEYFNYLKKKGFDYKVSKGCTWKKYENGGYREDVLQIKISW